MLKKYNIEDIYNEDCITGLQHSYSDWVLCQSIRKDGDFMKDLNSYKEKFGVRWGCCFIPY